MKKYWKWEFYFDGYGMIEAGYFDDRGNGYYNHYDRVFQIPWHLVWKNKIEGDFKVKEDEEE